MRRFGLKAKMTLVLAIVLFVVFPGASYVVDHYLKQELIRWITGHQQQDVARIAECLDDKLAMVSDLLTGVAQKNVPAELFRNPAAAQKFLEQRHTLNKLFEAGNGTFLFSSDGKIVAESATSPPRVGFDISHRDYFKRTIQTGKPVISSVYISSQPHHHPSIMFTAPVFWPDGSLAGILGGSFDLLRPNFIGDLINATVGKNGYYFLLDTERTIILHHDPSRIMKRDVPIGVNLLFDQAMQGVDSTGETMTTRGVLMLASYKHLAKTNWILGANLPLEEAYAPINNIEHIFWISRIIAIVLVLITAWFSMRRMITPLLSLTAQVKENNPSQRIVIETSDEINDLANAFNRQLELVEASAQKLQQERATYQTLSDFASDWIFWRNSDGNVVYSSPACEVVSGYTPAEITADSSLMETMIHPDDLNAWKHHTHQADAGNNPIPLQFRITTKKGEPRWIDHVCRPIYDSEGNFLGSRGSNRDITEFRLAQDSLYEQAELLEEEVAERQMAQEGLAVKQEQLLALNRSLEERISATIEELRQKDQMVIQQSRLAAMGEMINNIAHQWRQPLNNLGLIVQNNCYDFQAGLMTAEKMQQDMEQELQLIQFMSATIDDFRRFYRIDKEKSRFCVAESIRSAVTLVSASMKEHKIQIVVENGVPDLQITGYPNEYAQVLLNLLCNSRDVLIEHGIEGARITVAYRLSGDKSVVTLRDNGGGIADNILDRVFDPYFTTKEQGKGTGIGLYMSKIIIENNMGGSLTVRNVDGGAEFRIEV